MPRGFIGRTVESFFTETNQELTIAGQEHNQNPFEGDQNARGASVSAGDPRRTPPSETSDPSLSTNVNPPRLPPVRNQRLPFQVESALTGGFSLGIGNSTNVVVDRDTYENVMRSVNTVDDRAGEDVYRTATAIEEMCANIYIVPRTVPRILEVTGRLKSSLGEFRSLTEDAIIQVRGFVNEVSEIDMGNTSLVVVSESAAENVVRTVSNSMERQAESMEDTERNFETQAVSLEQQARDEMNMASQLESEASAMSIGSSC